MFITLIFLKTLKATHRIGRTGRAGKEGIAVTFVNPIEMDYIRQIEDANGRKMSALRPPIAKKYFKHVKMILKKKLKTGCLKSQNHA